MRPRPWNTGFEWQDHAGPFATITSEQAGAFDRDGFSVMEDFLKTPEDGRAAIAETRATPCSDPDRQLVVASRRS